MLLTLKDGKLFWIPFWIWIWSCPVNVIANGKEGDIRGEEKEGAKPSLAHWSPDIQMHTYEANRLYPIFYNLFLSNHEKVIQQTHVWHLNFTL